MKRGVVHAIDYDKILKVIKSANYSWVQKEKANKEIKFAFDHLDLVLTEAQRNRVFASNARLEDFLSSISAIVRCALHYKVLCQNGCFDDARFFLRKTFEYFAVAVAIGYDDDLYKMWVDEEFTRPKKGFSYLVKLLMKSANVPREEQDGLKWIMGNSDTFSGPNQYYLLSNLSVHGLSSKVLRAQVKDGAFNLDIEHVRQEEVHKKMMNAINILFWATDVVLGVFKYDQYVRDHGVTSRAKLIKQNHDKLREKLTRSLIN